MLTQNENKLDKNIRLGVGIVALLIGGFATTGTWQIVALTVGVLGVFTGLTGFCMLYKLLGLKTN